jgi:hypothetical protein
LYGVSSNQIAGPLYEMALSKKTKGERMSHIKTVVVALAVTLCCGVFGGYASYAQDARPVASDQTVLMTPEEFHQAIAAKNGDYANDAQLKVNGNGLVTGAILSGTLIDDYSPLEGVYLEMLDLSGLPINTISFLKGMPLKRLFISDTFVADLSPVQGAPLRTLWINNTRISDLQPLAGMKLVELNAHNCPVEDISVLSGMPLALVWLNGTKITDISPIGECPLVNLTIAGTNVSDLKPLAANPVLRLDVSGTRTEDLTPVKDLKLTRLIFTPMNIKTGLGYARSMKTITEIGTTLDSQTSPADFWARYDRGELSR